jgi:hypothetical protein
LEPKIRKEAMNSPWKKEWLEAECVELEALRAQDCLKKVNKNKLNVKKVLNSLWVYKLKRDKDNNIATFKARLTVRGDQQVEGADYNAVYAAVDFINILHLLLAVSPFLKLRATELDVKNAFLHGDLEEEVYLYYPRGYAAYAPGCVLSGTILSCVCYIISMILCYFIFVFMYICSIIHNDVNTMFACFT